MTSETLEKTGTGPATIFDHETDTRVTEPTPANDSTVEVARPYLSLEQAAAVLGKSLRALERSVMGKWGNRLPEGWAARKMPGANGLEWRIIPPPGFRVRQSVIASEPTSDSTDHLSDYLKTAAVKRKIALRPDEQSLDHPTIVIDRTDEVEHLLRELLQTQKQLAEERRLRLEDLRLITQMQGSMRLLEDKSSQTAKLREELEGVQKDFLDLKKQYEELQALPWWKRLFRSWSQ